MRDLGDCPEGFPVVAGSIGPSHGFVHVKEIGTPVEIFSMTVNDGDLVHADRHGALLIFDEMISGFRYAPGGAAEARGVEPHLATYGKALFGGLPSDMTWMLRSTPERWATHSELGIEVASGETATTVVAYRLGARIAGVVTNRSGCSASMSTPSRAPGSTRSMPVARLM